MGGGGVRTTFICLFLPGSVVRSLLGRWLLSDGVTFDGLA